MGKNRMRIFITLSVLLLIVSIPLQAGQFFGGSGLIHTNSALVVPPGGLDANFYLRGYTTTVLAETVTNGTSALALTYGFMDNIELGFTQIMYQDLNLTSRPGSEEVSELIPGDTYLRIKYGGIPIGDRAFVSAIGNIRYRLAEFHDVHMEPYQSDGIEGELIFAASQYWDPIHPDEDKSLHVNLGYINHNDGVGIMESSQEIPYLVGMFFPNGRIGFGFELYGAIFVKRPPEGVMGREDWTYATPIVKYQAFSTVNFTFGMDVLVSGRENTTHRYWMNALDEYPNYSDWRFSMRVNYTPYNVINIDALRKPGGSGSRTGGRMMGGGGGQYYDRQSLFRWAIEDQVGSVEAVDLDLEKLRQERIKAEEELKRLKRKLDQKKRNK